MNFDFDTLLGLGLVKVDLIFLPSFNVCQYLVISALQSVPLTFQSRIRRFDLRVALILH